MGPVTVPQGSSPDPHQPKSDASLATHGSGESQAATLDPLTRMYESLESAYIGKLLSQGAAQIAVQDSLAMTHPEIAGALGDVERALINEGFDVEIRAISSRLEKYPIVVVSVRDPITGEWILPNVNKAADAKSTEIDGSSEDRSLMGASTEMPESSAVDTSVTFERFPASAPVIFVLEEAGKVERLCDMLVQYTPEALGHALIHAAEKLRGERGDYVHLYDELIIGAAQRKLGELSAWFGEYQEPDINSARSRIDAHAIVLEASVPTPDSFTTHRLGIHLVQPSAGEKPFLSAKAIEL